MVKSIRVKTTETWGKVDKSLISSREFKCLDDGYMVNIADAVAREMIKKGWVINIDPLKEIKTPRKVMEVIHGRPDFTETVVNPGLPAEGSEDETGGTEDISPEDSGGEVVDNGGSGKGDAGGEAGVDETVNNA